MATVTAGLESHFLEKVTTLSSCVRITRRDGVVLGFTDHDKTIIYDGVDYIPMLNIPSNFRNEVNQKASNVSLDGFFVSGGMTRADFLAHLYDGAEILLFIINWNDTTQGIRILPGSGWFGKTKIEDYSFVAEFISLAEQLRTTEGKVFSRFCQYDFGDSDCGANLALFTETGTVTAVTNRSIITASVTQNQTLPSEASDMRDQDDWYSDGMLVWTSGSNDDYQRQVLKSTVESDGDHTLHLSLPTEFDVSVGDTFTISTGCPKSKQACIDRGQWTSTKVQHGGFPYIPRQDKMNQTGDLLG